MPENILLNKYPVSPAHEQALRMPACRVAPVNNIPPEPEVLEHCVHASNVQGGFSELKLVVLKQEVCARYYPVQRKNKSVACIIQRVRVPCA